MNGIRTRYMGLARNPIEGGFEAATAEAKMDDLEGIYISDNALSAAGLKQVRECYGDPAFKALIDEKMDNIPDFGQWCGLRKRAPMLIENRST